MTVIEIKIDNTKVPEDKIKDTCDSCPTQVYDIKDGKLVAARPKECIRCGVCESIIEGALEFVEED